jgi:hypothetical protein
MVSKRKYNKYFMQAVELVNTYTYLDYTQLDNCYKRLSMYADYYQEQVYDKTIILGCYMHDHIIKIPYVTRFSDKYTAKLNHELAYLMRYANIYKHGLFLTLTVDPKRFTNPKQMYQAVQVGFNKLMTYLRKQYDIKYYVKTVEFTASHLPHIHVMLFTDVYIPIQKVRELWNEKYNIGIMVRIEYIHTKYVISKDNEPYAIYPLNYILKYILKTYENTNDDKSTSTRIWQWSLRCRAYSVSYALVSLIKRKTNSNLEDQPKPCLWEYLISINEIQAREWVTYNQVRNYLEQLYGNG